MKNVLIINGNSKEENNEFDRYCGDLAKKLMYHGNEVREIILREKEIGDCIGCYACWLKTPGICTLRDNQEEVLKGYTWSDFVVIASPMIMGFVSALAKKSYDRILPLVHPFLRLDNDRMAHYPRYDKAYNIGILLDNAEQDDIDIIKQIFKSAVLIETMTQSTEEVAHEINNF